MKELIAKDKEFKIIPEDIVGSTKCIVKDVFDDEFEVELASGETYKQGEELELFSNTPQGVLYFQASVKELDGKMVKISYPENHKLLQRREYSRIDFSKEIVLIASDGKEIKVKGLDLSAGGMKITSEVSLELNESYNLNLDLEKNMTIKLCLQPIRVETDDLLGYTVSGRFKNIKNIDRISLVQFCFKKQLKDQNR